jgi:predicted HNH restriction endonuclease
MNKLDKIVAESKQNAMERGHGYREQALRLYPWICGKCKREFTRENVIELTVHHIDHNHDNNPTDGSNWELLCLYCHDHEHAKYQDSNLSVTRARNELERGHTTGKPFTNLKELMKKK